MVLPCVVVNKIIITGRLSKNYVVIYCLSHNCRMKLGLCCCVYNCGMFMCRFLEVHLIRPESINATCNKVGKHVWPCILRMKTNNLQWKHTFIVSGLTSHFVIGLPSNVNFARFA